MQKDMGAKRAIKMESMHEKQDNSITEKKADKPTSTVSYLSLSNLNLLD